MLPRSRPISGSEASMLFACTVGRKKYVTVGTKRISLEQLRKVLGLESVRDAAWQISSEKRLCRCGQTCARVLDTAIREINEKTDLNIALDEHGVGPASRLRTETREHPSIFAARLSGQASKVATLPCEVAALPSKPRLWWRARNRENL